MALTYFAGLVLIAASLSILMAGAWMVQQRTGNSGWVDTIRTLRAWPGRRRQRAMADRGRVPPPQEADAALPRRALSRSSVVYESILSAAPATMIPGNGAVSRKKIVLQQKGVAT